MKPERTLLEKIKVSPFTLFTTGVPSIDNPFSHPTTRELKHETAVFLLKRNAFSNFSPTGRTIEPFPLGPTNVTLEKIAAVFGWPAEPAASLSDSKLLESPIASETSLSRIARANCIFPLKPKSVSKSSSKPLYAIRCLQLTVPPNHSNESSPE